MSESCVICNENGDDLWEGFDDCSKCVSTKQHNERIKHLRWCEVGEHYADKDDS